MPTSNALHPAFDALVQGLEQLFGPNQVAQRLSDWDTHYAQVRPIALQPFLKGLDEANVKAVLETTLELLPEHPSLGPFYRQEFLNYLAWMDMPVVIDLAIQSTPECTPEVASLIRNAITWILGSGLEQRDPAWAALRHTSQNPEHRRRLRLAAESARDALTCVNLSGHHQRCLDHLLHCAGVS